MTPDELYAHSLGIRLDAPIECRPKAAAPPAASTLDDILTPRTVSMSEDDYRTIICCNHELHTELERLRKQLARARSAARRARMFPWLALLAAFAAGAFAGGMGR